MIAPAAVLSRSLRSLSLAAARLGDSPADRREMARRSREGGPSDHSSPLAEVRASWWGRLTAAGRKRSALAAVRLEGKTRVTEDCGRGQPCPLPWTSLSNSADRWGCHRAAQRRGKGSEATLTGLPSAPPSTRSGGGRHAKPTARKIPQEVSVIAIEHGRGAPLLDPIRVGSGKAVSGEGASDEAPRRSPSRTKGAGLVVDSHTAKGGDPRAAKGRSAPRERSASHHAWVSRAKA